MKNIRLMKELLEAKSPSGYEIEATRVWKNWMSELSKIEYSDKIGNSGFILGRGDKKVMISGHIDEIALMVGLVEEDGMIILQNLAGVDKKVLPGAQLLVRNEDGEWIKGITHKAPIHVEGRGKEAESVLKLESLKLDVGAESKKEVEDDYKIFPGSLVVLDRNIILEHGKNRVVGNALDDKVAVYILHEVAKNIVDDEELLRSYTFYFVACTQEESGLRGSKVAAHNINPDISIDIDVTFATNGGLVPKNKYGDIKLGEGPVIEFGQDKSRRISDLMIKVAKSEGIKFQRGVSRCGGTNTCAIQESSSDCETMLVSIPNLSMHTQNETCDWRDLEGAIQVITKSLRKL